MDAGAGPAASPFQAKTVPKAADHVPVAGEGEELRWVRHTTVCVPLNSDVSKAESL